MGTSLLLTCIGLLSFVGQLVCDQHQQQQQQTQHQQQKQQKQQQQLLLSSAAKELVEKLYEYDSLRPQIVYSPYSIHRALTMTSLGARGLNAEEMKKVLCITSLGDSVHSLYRELTQELSSRTDVTIQIGLGLYINPFYSIRPDFSESVTRNYFSEVANFNLTADGGAEKPINDYLLSKTPSLNGKPLIADSIEPDTSMILVNTAAFNGAWRTAFDSRLTRTEPLKLSTHPWKEVEMMHGDMTINYKRDTLNRVNIAELPFVGGRFTFYIVLPWDVRDLKKLAHLLIIPGMVDTLLSGLTPSRVRLAIPKFRYESTIYIRDVLLKLGLVMTTSPTVANFTGINEEENVFLEEMFYRSSINVQETGLGDGDPVEVNSCMAVASAAPKLKFIVDHAFLYFLLDKQSGQVILQGNFD